MARDWRVRVWDVATGKQIRSTQPGKSILIDVTASSDGRWIDPAGFDNVGRAWDALNPGPPLAILPHQSGVTTVRFSHDNRWLATGSYDGTARRWDRESGRPLPPIFRHLFGVSLVIPREEDRILGTAGFGGDARLWRLVPHDGAQAVLQSSEVSVLATFSREGCEVPLVTEDGRIRSWSPLSESPHAWMELSADSAPLARSRKQKARIRRSGPFRRSRANAYQLFAASVVAGAASAAAGTAEPPAISAGRSTNSRIAC